MKYQDYDLGWLDARRTVTVHLEGNAANVFLVDPSNLAAFKASRNYKHFGGHATKSPVQLVTPSAGHWHVVVNLGGYAGNVRTSVEVAV